MTLEDQKINFIKSKKTIVQLANYRNHEKKGKEKKEKK